MSDSPPAGENVATSVVQQLRDIALQLKCHGSSRGSDEQEGRVSYETDGFEPLTDHRSSRDGSEALTSGRRGRRGSGEWRENVALFALIEGGV